TGKGFPLNRSIVICIHPLTTKGETSCSYINIWKAIGRGMKMELNNYRYSDYSVEQLRAEVGKLKEKTLKAEQLGNISEARLYELNIEVGMAYMVSPADFHASDILEINGDPGHRFNIYYINGIFA